MQPIRQIVIDFIPHRQQRYPTCGDWFYEGDVLHIKVSATADERHQRLVAAHELVEALLCNAADVSQEAVDAFDMGTFLRDPGNSPDAPYHMQHELATVIERSLALATNVDWSEYEAALDALGE